MSVMEFIVWKVYFDNPDGQWPI